MKSSPDKPLSDDTTPRWYVFSVSFRKELDVRKELADKGFEPYIPMRYYLRLINGRKVRLLEPAVFGLVFVKGARNELLDYRGGSRLKSYMFLKSIRLTDGSLQYVQIREDDMQNFMKLNDVEGAQLTYYKPEELHIARGGKVRIMEGPFEGITGTVQKLPGKSGQYLVVSLSNVAIATVRIKPRFVKPLTQKIEKSKDVEKDSKRLAQDAIGLLIGKNTADRNHIIDEIRQLRESLKECKTVLTNDKALWLFAFYTSAMSLGEPYEDVRNQFVDLLPQLKVNNLLRPVARLVFYFETQDAAELQAADDIISKWDNTKYSDAQRRVIMLRRQLARGSKCDANNK